MATYNAAPDFGIYIPITGYPGMSAGGKVMGVTVYVTALPSGPANVKCAVYAGASATIGSNPTTLMDHLTATITAPGSLFFDFSRDSTTQPGYSLDGSLSALVAINQDVAVGYDSGSISAAYSITQAYSAFPTSSPGSLVPLSPFPTNLSATIVLGTFAPGPPSTDCGTGATDTAVEFFWQPSYTPQNYNLRYGPTGTDPSTWTVVTGIAGTPCLDQFDDVGLCYTVSPVPSGSAWDWQVQAVYIGYTSPWSATDTCAATGTLSASLAMDNLLVSGGPKTSELIFLEWSDDRGHTYGNPVGQKIGERGAYLTSVNWNRLGYARDRCFRLTWSVPVKTALQGAWIDADTKAKS